jgi:hypothetical protein
LRDEFAIAFPDDPTDASELVGESDGGLVVTSSSLDLEGPGSEPVGGFDSLGSPENGAGTMGEEHPDMAVAALADTTEPSNASGGMFSGSQTEIVCELTSRAKPLDISDKGDNGGRGEKPDSGNVPKASDDRHLPSERLELSFRLAHSRFESANFRAHFVQGCAEGVGDTRVRVFYELGNLRHNMLGPHRNEDSDLAQKTSQGVDPEVRASSHIDRIR